MTPQIRELEKQIESLQIQLGALRIAEWEQFVSRRKGNLEVGQPAVSHDGRPGRIGGFRGDPDTGEFGFWVELKNADGSYGPRKKAGKL